MSDEQNSMETAFAKNMDVRLLTLMRWNLRQDRSLREIAIPHDDTLRYVSFQNCHFVDVTDCRDITSDISYASLSNVYDKITQKRREIRSSSLYIQQSITLLGEDASFWKLARKDNHVLFVTMMKVRSGSKANEITFIRNLISSKLESHGFDKTKFALYAALDFCDFVLFFRDVSCSLAQEIIWSTLATDVNLQDTITLSCFAQTYLNDAFDNITKGSKLPCASVAQKHISISTDISIVDIKNWENVEQSLSQIGTHLEKKRISGRNDLQLRWKNISEDEVFRVIYHLDRAYEIIGGFELIPLLPYENRAISLSGSPNRLLGLSSEMEKVYRDLSNLQQDNCRVNEIILEIYHSLFLLAKGGFADCFILSILPALRAYQRVLAFYIEMKNEINRCQNLLNKDNTDEFIKVYSSTLFESNEAPHEPCELAKVLSSLQNRLDNAVTNVLQAEFIQALNLLIQCTIHGERQFLQVPSINCMTFDVPPKLLTLYAGATYQITNALNDSPEREFAFLIAPDYREDIYVNPISQSIGYRSKEKTHPVKLCIVHLNEKLFYHPKQLVCKLCHEVAHYVGVKSRQREARTDTILKSIAFRATCFIFCGIAEEGENKVLEQSPNVLDVITQALYESMLKYIDEHLHIQNSKNLIAALISENILYQVCRRTNYVEDLCDKIAQLIGTKVNDSELQKWAKLQIDDPLMTNYMKQLLENAATKKGARKTIAQKAVRELIDEVDRWSTEQQLLSNEVNFINVVVDACSEAYADMCMIKLLGLSNDDYHRLWPTGDEQPEYIATTLRKRAVENVLFNQEYSSEQTERAYGSGKVLRHVMLFAEKEISNYLNCCIERQQFNEKGLELLKNWLHTKSHTDLNKLLDQTERLFSEYYHNVNEQAGQSL